MRSFQPGKDVSFFFTDGTEISAWPLHSFEPGRPRLKFYTDDGDLILPVDLEKGIFRFVTTDQLLYLRPRGLL